MPLYFTSSGLNARLHLLDDGSLLLLTALIVVVACTSKGVVCGAAAKLTGRSTRQSLAIGALMNARGLVQLVILSIGLQHGVITPDPLRDDGRDDDRHHDGRLARAAPGLRAAPRRPARAPARRPSRCPRATAERGPRSGCRPLAPRQIPA